jgi:hypothetical protein
MAIRYESGANPRLYRYAMHHALGGLLLRKYDASAALEGWRILSQVDCFW